MKNTQTLELEMDAAVPTPATPGLPAPALRIPGTESSSDVYTRFTNQIIAAIESGAGTWTMPWNRTSSSSSRRSPAVMPVNVESGKTYRGVNVLALWASAIEHGYESSEWGTYKQWAAKGAQVRKGEKSTFIVFWKFFDKPKGGSADVVSVPDATGDSTPSAKSATMMARGYSVFNAAQVDGYTPKTPVTPLVPSEPVPPPTTGELLPDARTLVLAPFFASLGGDVRHGGDRATYSPLFDVITVPEYRNFHSLEAYYGTLSHEYVHWTGHSSRLSRDLKNRFGTEAYAAEELVAELGSAFLCGTLNLYTEPRPDHAQYLSHWLQILKSDKRAIFTAASKAQQAVDFLLARSAGVTAPAAEPETDADADADADMDTETSDLSDSLGSTSAHYWKDGKFVTK